MERIARLAQLWNWLPAFRVVAETQHLPSAAKALGLSPSALSRSVTQLESALGQPLFVRSKNRMQLSPGGEALLGSVREAMRRVDDGIDALSGARRMVRVAADATWIGLLVAPALEKTQLEVEHVELGSLAVREALLRGIVDLALVELAPPSAELVVERLGAVERAVCMTARHKPAQFAVRTDVEDGWPSGVERAIALRAARFEPVLEACRSGALRAVLPNVVARAHDLQMLASPRLAPSQLYLVRRRPFGRDPFESLGRAIRVHAASVLVDPRAT